MQNLPASQTALPWNTLQGRSIFFGRLCNC